MAADPRVGVDDVVIPVVGECDDSWLSDARVAHVQPGDVGRAVADARTDFEQGAVGAGAGMSCFDWKGGIGSSSRRAGDHTVGVLLLTNFGTREQLRRRRGPRRPLARRASRRSARPRGQLHRSRRNRRARSRRRSSSGSRAARASDSRAPARSPTTAAARSSLPSRPRTSAPSQTAISIRSSRLPSTRRRRQCCARCGPRSTRSAGRGGWYVHSRERRCSSSTAAAAGRSRRTAEGRGRARHGPSPPRVG